MKYEIGRNAVKRIEELVIKKGPRITDDPNIIRVAGNLKAEIELPVYEENDLRHLRNELGIQETDKVIILGSTRRGEEEQLLEAFLESNEQRSDLKLILVPRQLDRVNEVEKICRDYSQSDCVKFSKEPAEKIYFKTADDFKKYLSKKKINFEFEKK